MIIDGHTILPGENKVISITAGKLPSGNRISIKAHVFRAKKDGPILLIQGGVHGDEINGVEIVRSAIAKGCFDKLECGSIIAIPLLNIYGFINFSRSVPDGKDVNRSFPGYSKGSLASRIARKLTKHILPYVDFAVDFHTGGAERYNWPQIRYTKGDKRSRKLADVFSANCTIQKNLIDKSFRQTAYNMNIPTIVFEGGESVRFDKESIQLGVEGMHRVMKYLGLIKKAKKSIITPIYIKKTSWVRAPNSGIFIWKKKSGAKVKKGDVLGNIYDPFGTSVIQVLSEKEGVLIGHNNATVVNQGDALFNIGY